MCIICCVKCIWCFQSPQNNLICELDKSLVHREVAFPTYKIWILLLLNWISLCWKDWELYALIKLEHWNENSVELNVNFQKKIKLELQCTFLFTEMLTEYLLEPSWDVPNLLRIRLHPIYMTFDGDQSLSSAITAIRGIQTWFLTHNK